MAFLFSGVEHWRLVWNSLEVSTRKPPINAKQQKIGHINRLENYERGDQIQDFDDGGLPIGESALQLCKTNSSRNAIFLLCRKALPIVPPV